MFEQFCANAANDGSRSAGNAMIFCKRAIENFNEEMAHNIDIPSNQQSGQQVVFIQPPSTNYNHQVTLTGQGAQGQKAVIYVLPQKNTHTIRPNFNLAGPAAPAKPTVYFLRNNGAGGPSTTSVGGSFVSNNAISSAGPSQGDFQNVGNVGPSSFGPSGPSSFGPRPNSFGPGNNNNGPRPFGPGPMQGGGRPGGPGPQFGGNYGWGQ